MDRFIGLDAHNESCTFAVMGPTGRKSGLEVIDTQADPIHRFLTGLTGRKVLCMEEGMHCEWLYEIIEPLVDEIAVVQPDPSSGNKSDAADAWRLADRARLGNYGRTVFKAPRTLTELRQATRIYLTTRRDVVRLKSQLRLLCRSRGVECTRRLYQPDHRDPMLSALPLAYRKRADLLAKQLDAVEAIHDEAKIWMLKKAKTSPDVVRLTSVPGLGPIRAALVVAVMVSPNRFRTKRQLWDYSCLGIVTRSSADWVRQDNSWVRAHVPQTRGLNTNRNPILKEVFVGAATRVIQMSEEHPLKARYLRILDGGTKPNLAKLTIARKIAAAVLGMWKKKEVYDPSKHVC